MAMIAARGMIPKIFPLEDKLRSSPAGVLDASSDLHFPSWQLHILGMWSGLQVKHRDDCDNPAGAFRIPSNICNSVELYFRDLSDLCHGKA
jgi:hypothetical protein